MSSQLSADVCQSFLVGCDELVDKSLQGAISSLEELEVKAQQLGDVSAAKIVRLMHSVYPHLLLPFTQKILLIE